MRWVAAIAATLVLAAGVEFAMGRVPIWKGGVVRLWVGEPVGPENSQQIADWYTFSHIIHGMVLYAIAWWIGKKRGWSVWQMLFFAVAIEAAWEIFENTNFIIDRYRTVTLSLDYYGDSILNSLSDIFAMMGGFYLARKLPVLLTLILILVLEIWVGYFIRDNLTLNVIMLVHPIESIRQWQAGT